jgi:Inner membrane component of T3SS, cytoplasmic domain/Calcineurin-like phosphoesterase
MSDWTIFTWLHLSDIHFGHGDATHYAHQQALLDAMRQDIRQVAAANAFDVDAMFLTGDVAFSGGALQRHTDEYDDALNWLNAVAADLELRVDSLYVVPGNHDVDRSVDLTPDIRELVSSIRANPRALDLALRDPPQRAMLGKRMQRYLAFERQLRGEVSSDESASRLYWVAGRALSGSIYLRIVGLNSALVAADNQDAGHLAIGMVQVSETLQGIRDNEIVFVLAHHPFGKEWFADDETVRPFVFSRATVDLTGHIHNANGQYVASAAGVRHIHLGAGSVHGEMESAGEVVSHGYSFGGIVVKDGDLQLRVWPRRWSPRSGIFVADSENSGPAGYAEYPITVGRRALEVKRRRFLLSVTHGPDAGKILPLERTSYLLGRDRAALLRLPQDGHTSRRHASLLVTPSAVMLQDESKHGTLINGEPAPHFVPIRLRENDTIQLGTTILRLGVVHDPDSLSEPLPT